MKYDVHIVLSKGTTGKFTVVADRIYVRADRTLLFYDAESVEIAAVGPGVWTHVAPTPAPAGTGGTP